MLSLLWMTPSEKSRLKDLALQGVMRRLKDRGQHQPGASVESRLTDRVQHQSRSTVSRLWGRAGHQPARDRSPESAAAPPQSQKGDNTQLNRPAKAVPRTASQEAT